MPQANKPVRYAIIGAGHISQVATMPGFQNAENSKLVALFSSDPEKRDELQRRYDLQHVADYDDFERFLGKGLVDAVYIGLPNHLHCEYTERAARHGVHVLCEKPMAVDEAECERMIRAAEDHEVKLMIGYRLHFDPANLEAVEIVGKGELGEARLFSSTFTQNVQAGNVRLADVAQGGGPVFDMGVYCINAARYLFAEEPIEVCAFAASKEDGRFTRSPEMVSTVLRFPEEKLAAFTTSFGSFRVSRYTVVGTKGRLVMEPAYEYAKPLHYEIETEAGTRERTFEKHDQFGAQLLYFSQCILEDRDPEPDGLSGLADVHIVRAVHASAVRGGAPVSLLPVRQNRRPDGSMKIALPGVEKPPEIHAESPSGS